MSKTLKVFVGLVFLFVAEVIFTRWLHSYLGEGVMSLAELPINAVILVGNLKLLIQVVQRYLLD